MTEAFLHYVWQHQMFADRLLTTDGQPVRVYRVGTLNVDAGPDFFNAHVSIGDVEWVGNVEIHIHSSDWTAHGHQHDAAYNNVVLHVVYEHNAEVRLQNGKVPPTLELRSYLHPALVANYEHLTAPATGSVPVCHADLRNMPDFVKTTFLQRLAVERVEGKTMVVRRLLDESCGSWEKTCYWLMARYFGGKVNGLAFELLAKATDQRFLARWRDNRQRLEALLMGQAGMLEGYFDDDYPRELQADYQAIRSGFADLRPLDASLWRFFKLRPSSFPTFRISQFADFVAQSHNLFSALLDMSDVREMERLFDREASPYWDNHYRFDRESEKTKRKCVGKQLSDSLIINAWVPLLFVYGVEHGQSHYKEQAFALLEQLPAEDNAVVRTWQQAGIVPKNAAESQSLIQLSSAYCSNRRCLECRFGYQLLKHQ